jgi:hypothetical protein
MIEVKQSVYNHPDQTSGPHTNGPPNTFVRQVGGKWFVVNTNWFGMEEVVVRARVKTLGFERFVSVYCLAVEE